MTFYNSLRIRLCYDSYDLIIVVLRIVCVMIHMTLL